MLDWDLWYAWRMRAFLIGGLVIIVIDLLSQGILDLEVPIEVYIYLFVAGFYFAINLRSRVATRRQELLVHFFFPGAFITTLLPVYTLVLFLAKHGWL